jgi:flagellar hook assembly protein FlgD
VELEPTAGEGGQRTLPAVTRLLPCTPNPFRSDTVVRFALAAEGPVMVQVFGVDGRLVRTLLRGALPAGTRSVRWDGRDDGGRPVAAGAYLLRLKTADGTDARRVIRTH